MRRPVLRHPSPVVSHQRSPSLRRGLLPAGELRVIKPELGSESGTCPGHDVYCVLQQDSIIFLSFSFSFLLLHFLGFGFSCLSCSMNPAIMVPVLALSHMSCGVPARHSVCGCPMPRPSSPLFYHDYQCSAHQPHDDSQTRTDFFLPRLSHLLNTLTSCQPHVQWHRRAVGPMWRRAAKISAGP